MNTTHAWQAGQQLRRDCCPLPPLATLQLVVLGRPVAHTPHRHATISRHIQ